MGWVLLVVFCFASGHHELSGLKQGKLILSLFPWSGVQHMLVESFAQGSQAEIHVSAGAVSPAGGWTGEICFQVPSAGSSFISLQLCD